MIDLENFFENMMEDLNSLNEETKQNEKENCSCKNGEKCHCHDKDEKRYSSSKPKTEDKLHYNGNYPTIFCLEYESFNEDEKTQKSDSQWFSTKEKAIEQMKKEFNKELLEDDWDNIALLTFKPEDIEEDDFIEHAMLINKSISHFWSIEENVIN